MYYLWLTCMKRDAGAASAFCSFRYCCQDQDRLLTLTEEQYMSFSHWSQPTTDQQQQEVDSKPHDAAQAAHDGLLVCPVSQSESQMLLPWVLLTLFFISSYFSSFWLFPVQTGSKHGSEGELNLHESSILSCIHRRETFTSRASVWYWSNEGELEPYPDDIRGYVKGWNDQVIWPLWLSIC